MRKLIFTLLMLLTTVWSHAQTCVWSENFDAAVTMVPGGTPGWSVDNSLFVSSANSYRGQFDVNGITLTSPVIDLTGLNFVKLEFDQIAKIEFTDSARMEISINNGPWQKVNAANGCIYEGNSPSFLSNGEKFAESSYFDWQPGTTTIPTNAWWKNEVFDISAIAGNQSNVRIRFVGLDGPGANGMNGRYGWMLDNICVIGAPCELNPNTFSFAGYPYFQGNLYTAVPWDVYVDLIDPSGIQSAELFWTISSDPVPGTVNQFGGMVDFGGGTWAGQIWSTVNVDDTVCWWIESVDNSGCGNIARWPATGCIQFILKGGIAYPYCDDFDLQNPPFTDSLGGSGVDIWQLGTPTFTAANSGLNAWAIGLSAPYTNDAEAYLTSPNHDFTGISAANLSFYQYFDTENGWDGTRMEYSIDGGSTWSLLGTGSELAPDPNGTNWYTDDELNSSTTNAWEGNSNGWIESRYKLGFVPGLMGASNIKFRYVFTSDPSVTGAGYAIDDWCIQLPDTFDTGVTGIVSPVCGSGLPEGDPFVMQVNVENFGLATLSGFDIFYSINNGTPVATPFPGNLTPNSVVPVTLAPGVVIAGAFDVCVWTDYSGDNIGTNDTVCCTFSGIPTITPTYCDDFESGNIGWYTTLGVGAPTTSVWELGAPAFGATTGANSGANAWDINLSSAYDNQAETYLYTPYFDVTAVSSGSLEFWMNFDTEQAWDGVRIEYTLDNGTTWNVLGNGPATTTPFPAPAGADPCGVNWYNDNELNSSVLPAWCGTSNGWVKAVYKLCCATGLFGNPIPIQFRYSFDSDFSVIGDGFSIDDFCLYASTGDDVGVSAIVSPSGGVPSGTSQTVILTVENYGSTTIASIPVSYSVNGGSPVSFIWTGTLAPCGVTTITMPPSIFVQGVNDIVAYTSLGTDVNLNNDTSKVSVIGQPTLTPTYDNNYVDDFESGNIGWAPSSLTGSGNNIWELGLPNYGQTTNANSPSNAWDVNLSTEVTNNATVILTTPYFDLTNAIQASMRFWQNRSIGAFGDEFFIEYDINNANNWQRLGTATTPGVSNWYNGAGNFWDAASAGWVFCEYKNINAEVGNPTLIQFRFVLETGFAAARDGVSIDDFELFVPIPLSVTPTAVNTSIPNQLIFPGQPITFATPVKNNGINTVFNHNITLTIDGGLVSTAPVSYTPNGLTPDSSQTFNFPNTWIAVPGFHTVCAYTDSPNGSLDLTQFDDTVCTTVHVFDSVTTNQLPYCNSFESGTRWVTVNAISYRNNSIWEEGAPAQAFINNAHTGARAWSTLLTADYSNTDSSGLFSSVLRVQSNRCYKLSFWQKFRMEFGSDGGAIDYSTDYGATWNRIDYAGTPNVTLFGANSNYTYVTTLDPANPAERGFTGYQNDWMYTEKVLRPNTDGQMIIRFRFASDFSTRDEGWAIDDFCFEDLGLCSPIGMNEFIYGDFGISQNYPNPANDLTTFEYLIPEQGQVLLTVVNMMGQTIAEVENQSKAAGTHKVQFNTGTLAPGIYMYTLRFNDQQITKRMVITR